MYKNLTWGFDPFAFGERRGVFSLGNAKFKVNASLATNHTTLFQDPSARQAHHE